ncbi:MAG: hypothetical protein R3249_03540 [Nitriliruptorales bacterium]|nr:hypothetical protein [Nitriliruptorales bacterium]
MSESQRIIRSYYAIAALFTLSASIIWGVNTLFLLDAGLDLFGVFVANAGYSLGTFLFEIPTGVVADTLGRRTSFLLSVVVLGVVTLAYVGLAAVGAGLIPFALVSILLGLGFTFYSGAVDAWLVDALATTDHSGPLDPVFARAGMFRGASMILGTVGGGLLGQLDLALPFVVRSALLALLFVVAWGRMYDIGYVPRSLTRHNAIEEMVATGRNGIRTALGTPDLRLVVVAGSVSSGFFIYAWYAWPPHFLELFGDSGAVWVAGLVTAGMSVAMLLGNLLVERVLGTVERRTTLIIWGFLMVAAGAFVVGTSDDFWVAVAALLAMTLAWGLMTPVRTAYLHASVPSAHRATAVSTDSMVTGMTQVGGQVGLGALGRSRGEPAGYLVGSVVMVAALPLLLAVRRMGAIGDQIEEGGRIVVVDDAASTALLLSTDFPPDEAHGVKHRDDR